MFSKILILFLSSISKDYLAKALFNPHIPIICTPHLYNDILFLTQLILCRTNQFISL